MPKDFKNLGLQQSGFSLVEIVVGFAILTGLALTMMKIQEFANFTRTRIASKRELLKIKRHTRILLENKEACDLTFKGLEFRGSDIPRIPTSLEDLDILNPLHSVKPRYQLNDGDPGQYIFSPDPIDKDLLNRPLNSFGPITIEGSELYMPEHVSGLNLPNSQLSNVTYPAALAIRTTTTLPDGKKIDNALLKFRVYVSVKTSPTGQSEITGCQSDSLSSRKLFYAEYHGNNLDQPVEENTGNPETDRKNFYMCGFVSQSHSPDEYRFAQPLVAHYSESRCKLTPSGAGPFYNWSITTTARHGSTRCHVVCL